MCCTVLKSSLGETSSPKFHLVFLCCQVAITVALSQLDITSICVKFRVPSIVEERIDRC